MFGCSYTYFMQGLEIASECTRKHLRTPKIPKFSLGSMPPRPHLQVVSPDPPGKPHSQASVPSFFHLRLPPGAQVTPSYSPAQCLKEGILERLQQIAVSPESDCYNMNTGTLHSGFKWQTLIYE